MNVNQITRGDKEFLAIKDGGLQGRWRMDGAPRVEEVRKKDKFFWAGVQIHSAQGPKKEVSVL